MFLTSPLIEQAIALKTQVHAASILAKNLA